MAALVCDICGGKLVMGAGGIAVCDSCGMEHSADRMKEKVQEITGTVRVDNTHMITNYLGMTASALEAGNNEEAENYANKILEIDPNSDKAWFYKGKAVGWQTTGRNNRFPESIVNWINAYRVSTPETRDDLAINIQIEAMKLGEALIRMNCDSFANYRSETNKDDIIKALSMIEEQLGLLNKKTNIEVYTNEFKTVLARTINNGACGASNNSDEEFGPNNKDRNKYSWERYTASMNLCLALLDKAYFVCCGDEVCHTICSNYITIAEKVRDSCSYKYQTNAYGIGVYVKEYSYTESAKDSRTKIINNWKKKQEAHSPAIRKSNCQKAIELYQTYCSEEGRQFAIVKYWQSHMNEKTALDNELEGIKAKRLYLNEQAANNADKQKSNQIENEIVATRRQLESLGLFKGKEKKALATRIEELTVEKKNCEDRWKFAKEQINSMDNALKLREAAINQELSKDRGTAKAMPKQYITVFSNGTGVVSALDLVTYHQAILPNGFSVKGEGKEAVLNYSQNMMKLFSVFSLAFSGDKKEIAEINSKCTENSDYYKVYRINFLANGEESQVSVNVTSKRKEAPIANNLYYELDKSKTPRAVANFIAIVVSSLSGILPAIDLTGMERKISEAAYGLAPETSIETEDLVCTITSGVKNTLRVTIKSKPITSNQEL